MIKELSYYNFIKYSDLNIDKLLDKGNAEVFKGKYLEKDVAIKKYKNDENGFAKKAGTFEAYAVMDNDTFKRAIKNIEKMQKELGEA